VQTSVDSTGHSPSSSAVVIGADEDASYRTMSVLAIVSLLLGLAAPLALFGPLLFVLPIAGIVVALLAIRRIALSEGTLIGRKAALVGIALSIASMTAAYTRAELTQALLSRGARSTALEWFSLMQAGKAESALSLMSQSRKSPPRAEPGAPPPTGPVLTPVESLRADPVAHFLLEHAAGAPVEFVSAEPALLYPSGEASIDQTYTVGVPSETTSAPVTTVKVTVVRPRSADGAPSQWLVSGGRSDDIRIEGDGHVH
jgi:hypothetical protein